jgi:hypothetical protein
MNPGKGRMFLIKIAYWLGIGADGLWSVALFYPPLFGLLTGNPDFDPDMQVRLIMGIGGSLMTGWTLLLLWAVRRPIERRFVILLTAYPVVFGMFIVSMIGIMDGSTSNIWLLAKTTILMISMTTSYILSARIRSRKFPVSSLGTKLIL